MKETAPENDAVSIERGGEPDSMIPDNTQRIPFVDTEQPLGVHLSAFWQDCIFDHIPADRTNEMDKNSSKYRKVIILTERAGHNVTLKKIELWLQFEIGAEKRLIEVAL